MKVKKVLITIFSTALLVGIFILANFAVSGEGVSVEKLLKNLKETYKPPVPLLPHGVFEVAGFKKGAGLPIGKVNEAQGTVLVIHQGQKSAYRLKKDFPIFTNDTVITGKRSRVSVSLNDKSVIGLASYSKIVINKSVYNPKKKKRSSFLSLLFGRARFIVTKIMGEKKVDYKIKTPTAVCGIRGSDFALAVTPVKKMASSKQNFFSHLRLIDIAHAQIGPESLITTVLTGANTSITFQGLVGPVQVLESFSLSAASFGSAAISATAISPAIAGGILSGIAPQLGALSMPPGMDD